MTPDLRFYLMIMLGVFALCFFALGTWLSKRAIETKSEDVGAGALFAFLAVAATLLGAAGAVLLK